MIRSARGFTLISRSERAFTLIELLVVIAIISILAVIGITIFTSVQRNARDARRKADVSSIANAFEVRYQNNGRYSAVVGTNFNSGSIPEIQTGSVIITKP